jgi:hypothetical protein
MQNQAQPQTISKVRENVVVQKKRVMF